MKICFSHTDEMNIYYIISNYHTFIPVVLGSILLSSLETTGARNISSG